MSNPDFSLSWENSSQENRLSSTSLARIAHGVFFVLVCALFISLGINRWVYPPLYASAVLAILLLAWAWRGRRKPLNRAWLYPLPFLVFTAVSPGVWFKDMPLADMMAAAYFCGLGVGCLFKRSWIFLLCLALTVGGSFFLFALGGSSLFSTFGQENRLMLFFHHPNVLALMAAWALFALISAPKSHRLWIEGARYALCILLFFSIALSGARAAYVGLACVLGVLLLFHHLQRRKLKKLLVLGAACLCVYALLPAPQQARIVSTISSPTEDKAFRSRLPIWEAAWSGFRASPLIGKAQRHFYDYHNAYKTAHLEEMKKKYPEMEPNAGHPHSIYLGLLFMGGVLGAALFICAFAPAVRQAWKQKNLYFISLTVFFLGYGLFDFPLHRKDGAVYLFFPLGVAYGRSLFTTFSDHLSSKDAPAHVSSA